MNRFLIFFCWLIILMGSCNRPSIIDNNFPWKSSGVAEADSLLLEFERYRVSKHYRQGQPNVFSERFCSIAGQYPDNPILQIRKEYLSFDSILHKDISMSMIDGVMAKIDSANYPYDWHIWNTLRAERENNPIKKYNLIIENLRFFEAQKVSVEIGRNLTLLGGLMHELNDSIRAFEAFKKAEGIAVELDMPRFRQISQLNMALVAPPVKRDSIYSILLKDSSLKEHPYAYIQFAQNYYNLTDSIELLDEAIELFNHSVTNRNNLPFLLALKGEYLIRHNHLNAGMVLLDRAFDSLANQAYLTRYILLMHFYKANGWWEVNEKDSCIKELKQVLFWNDSLDKELNRPEIYALDARSRIEMAEKNAKLERTRIIYLWIISLLCLMIVIILITYRHKQRIAEKKRREDRLEENIRRNRQSIIAQNSVMEQAANLINHLTDRIANLQEQGDIDKETATVIMKELRLHKSDEENRQGFLKLQQDLDTRFMNLLKSDFPSLSETQLRLASLIAVGLDNRQIGNILNIEQTSVHKSRYRLRTKFGLKRNDSLEEFLRRYNNVDYKAD